MTSKAVVAETQFGRRVDGMGEPHPEGSYYTLLLWPKGAHEPTKVLLSHGGLEQLYAEAKAILERDRQ